MRGKFVRHFVTRLLLCAPAVLLAACGGGGATGVKPNAAGVPDSLVFDVQTGDVVIGDTARLRVTARDAAGNAVPNVAVTWRSLNPSVATVSADGLVTGVDMGETEIEVEANVAGGSPALFIDTSMVHGAAFRVVKSRRPMIIIPILAISPTTATVEVQKKQPFSVSITNKNDIQLRNRPETIWSSSNPSVATIGVDGLAVGVAKGSAIITATVSVGPTRQVQKSATLTVTESACGGIALVDTLTSTVKYDYAFAGTSESGSRIGSEYHGTLSARLGNLGWSPGIPTVVWTGVLSGSASQVETASDDQGNVVGRLEGAGAPLKDPLVSKMNVIVELATCTYRMNLEVDLNLKRTNFGQTTPLMPSASVSVYLGRGSLTPGSSTPFPPFLDKFDGHSALYAGLNPTKDAFVPLGFASELMQGTSTEKGVGAADMGITVFVVKP